MIISPKLHQNHYRLYLTAGNSKLKTFIGFLHLFKYRRKDFSCKNQLKGHMEQRDKMWQNAFLFFITEAVFFILKLGFKSKCMGCKHWSSPVSKLQIITVQPAAFSSHCEIRCITYNIFSNYFVRFSSVSSMRLSASLSECVSLSWSSMNHVASTVFPTGQLYSTVRKMLSRL